MKVYRQLTEIQPLKHAVVTSGTFDGVHIGHQKILHRLNEVAQEKGGESVVLTFWPHPRQVVSEDSQHLKLLTTIEEKIELIENQGVDHLLVLPFTREFSELSAYDYVNDILKKAIGTQTLVIGYDHRFGRNREGSFGYLQENQQAFDIQIEEITRQEIDDLTVSSTQIRNALQEGNVTLANSLLGRKYAFSGIVAKGRQLGRQLGFPTANVQVQQRYKLIPANGVYAVDVFIRGQVFKGMMNIGTRPTVEGTGRTQEVHIFDFSDEIYGEYLTVALTQFIRPEQKFADVNQLRTQIAADAQLIRQLP